MTARRPVAALLLALVVSLLAGGTAAAAVPARSAPATPASPSASGPPGSAVTTFGSCLTGARSGDLLLVIDESSSLRGTDPRNDRVTAAKYLLQRMSQFADRAGVRLDVSAAGFSDDYRTEIGWTPLTGSSLPGLNQGMDTFAGRNDGYETDYWTALEKARRDLADRAVAAGKPAQRCQAIAWFSDGRLDITPRTTDTDRDEHGVTKPFAPGPIDSQPAADAAIAAARQLLCAPRSGLTDQLRSTGVTMFAVGLASGTSGERDFDLMRSIATGDPTPTTPTCGQPANRRPGEFTLASDIDGLLFAFDQFATPGSPPLQNEQGVCQGPDLRCGDRHPFVLDPSIKTVQILGSVDTDGIDAALISPSGQVLPLGEKVIGRTGTAGQGPTRITYTWLSTRTVSVDMSTQDSKDGWSGEWALVFVDPRATSPGAVSRSNIHIAGDLVPSWPNRPTLHSGDRITDARFGLVDGAGREVVPSSILGSLSYSAALLRPGAPDTVVVKGLDKAALGRPTTVDLSAIEPGPATLRLTLEVTTAAARRADGSAAPGTRLAPSSVDVPVQIAAPAGFPQVAESVDFGTVDDATRAPGELSVSGPGCVWVPGQDDLEPTAVPQGAGRITVAGTDNTDAASCLPVADGETATLPLQLSTTDRGNGTLTGSMRVFVAPENEPGQARPVSVTVTADLRKPLDPFNFWLALVAALVAGPGVPLLLLYLARAVTARFPRRSVFSRLVDVTVPGPDGPVLRGGARFAFVESDFDASAYSSLHGRRATLSGVDLRTRWRGSPFGPGYVVVGARDGGRTVAASSGRPPRHRRDARLPLAVQNTWVVLHDTTGPPEAARVLVILGDDAGPDLRERLRLDIVDRLPVLLGALRGDRRDTPPGPPGGGPGQTPPPPPPPTSTFSFDDVPSGGGPTRPTWQTTPGDRR